MALTGGSSYSVCDGGDVDADPTSGNTELDNVVAGDYALSVTPPDGYELAGDVPASVSIEAGGIASLTLTFRPTTAASPAGTVSVQEAPGFAIFALTLEDGTTPFGGVCLNLSGPDSLRACDNGEGDADPTLGILEIDDLAPGEYTLGVTPPDGYDAVEPPSTVVVPSADVVQVALAFRPAGTPPAATPISTETTEPAAEGIVLVQSSLEDGVTPFGGVCIGLTGPNAYQVCDDGDGDADPTLGAIEVDAVTIGEYTLSITPPDGYEAIEPPATVAVPSGDFAQVVLRFRPVATPPAASPAPTETTESTPEQPAAGVVVVQAHLEDGVTPIGGTCIELAGPGSYSVCDNGEGDADPTMGTIEIDDVAAGDYTVAVQPPPDHEAVGEAPAGVHVDADQSASLVLTFRPLAAATPTAVPTEEPTVEATPAPAPGTLVISKVDAADGTAPLGGACFTITAADGSTADACDDDGDGQTRFEGLVPGDWRIQETRAPAGYEPGPEQTVTVPEGAEATAVVPNAALPPRIGTLAALALDPEDKPLPGACYVATGPDGAAVDGCDDDGDGRADLGEVAAGDWLVRQTEPPAGHDPTAPPEQTVAVATDQPGEARFVNAPTPPDQLRLPPSLPKPTSVVVVGDFQDELGCPQDNDPTCPATALTENHGIWIGSFPIPPGTHSFRLVATSDAERSLGQGADPNGPDLVVTVPEGTATVYVEYNPATGRIIAAPRPVRAQVSSDAGTIELRPIEHGRFEGYFDAPAGTVPFKVLLNGQPVVEDQIELDQDSRVHIVVAADGTIVTIETVTPAALTVTRTNTNGAAVPGSCFAVLAADGNLASQTCDADDGVADGLTTIAFPNGLQAGSYTLRETLAPEGATPAPDQPVELVAGDNRVTVAI